MNDLVDRVRESTRRLEADVVRLLAGATASAERAMREATDARARGEDAVRAAIARLDEAAGVCRSMLTGDEEARPR